MSKESNRRKFVWNFFKWLWQRIAYWGDKVLTFGFYIVFGLFILSYRLMRWVREWSSKGFMYAMRGIKSHWQAYRLQKRIKYEYDVLGKKDYYKELREQEK